VHKDRVHNNLAEIQDLLNRGRRVTGVWVAKNGRWSQGPEGNEHGGHSHGNLAQEMPPGKRIRERNHF
jgi:hypothetical protein